VFPGVVDGLPAGLRAAGLPAVTRFAFTARLTIAALDPLAHD